MRIAFISDYQNNVTMMPEIARLNTPQPRETPDRRVFDIIIVDVTTANTKTLGTIKSLIAEFPYTKIIITCSHLDSDSAQLLINSGVSGIMSRHELTDSFLHFIRSIYDGRIVISPMFMQAFISTA